MRTFFGMPLVFVDVETDGMNYIHGHVTEVAAIRVENGEITKELVTLVNPGVPIPRFITDITGITDADVADAPSFADIADELAALCEGAVFVAHNVRFDYNFLTNEFKRVGKQFHPKLLCTVKLSRALYPDLHRHRLSDLIDYHGFSYALRHRAYDDAMVLVQFWHKITNDFELSHIYQAVNLQLKAPALPKNLDAKIVKSLPETHGVYIFEDETGAPLYIGKSVNIKRRVMSHFTADTDAHKEFKISQLVYHVRYIETAGELSALLTESAMIKTELPVYNAKLRRVSKLTITERSENDAGYIILSLKEYSPGDIAEYRDIIAMHPRRSSAKQSLLRHVQTFELCPKLCGLERGKGACFSYQLGKCKGACVGKEPVDKYNQRLMMAYAHRGVDEWPHSGRVVITEQQASSGKQVGYVVNNWIIEGIIHADEFSDPIFTPYDAIFDLDAYMILRSYLLRHPERVIIQDYLGEFDN